MLGIFHALSAMISGPKKVPLTYGDDKKVVGYIQSVSIDEHGVGVMIKMDPDFDISGKILGTHVEGVSIDQLRKAQKSE